MGFAVEVHHGENPDVVGALDVDDAVGKLAGEMPAGRLADETEGAGSPAGFDDQLVDDGVETPAQLGNDAA